MRAFILGNSGELLDHDLDLLKGETVFGCNLLPLHNPDIITHYICADIVMAFVPEVRALVPASAMKYYSRLVWNTIREEEGVHVFDTHEGMGFNVSSDVVFMGGMVTYCALQIAASLGYDEIYLLGVDLGIPANGVHHIPAYGTLDALLKKKNLRNSTVDKRLAPVTDYGTFSKESNKFFNLAKFELDKLGIQVFNLSKGGNLKAFPRKSYESVLTSNHEAEIVSDVELK